MQYSSLKRHGSGNAHIFSMCLVLWPHIYLRKGIMLKMTPNALLAGERSNSQGKAISNKILLALPDEEFRALRPDLEFIPMPHHRILYEPNRKIESVYFPNSGLISLVIVMADRKTVEVAVLGSEGFAGVPSIAGLTRSPVREVVQIAGDGFKMDAEVFRQALQSSLVLQAALHRYSIVLGMQISQTAACNRLHDIEQRFARWLLMAQDRVDNGSVRITHDFLATMLGTDRPTVSVAAAALQRKEIIDYTRGTVHILNRKALEQTACECYQMIQQFNSEINLK
jgi:CRP-like cAMP-binding protein